MQLVIVMRPKIRGKFDGIYLYNNRHPDATRAGNFPCANHPGMAVTVGLIDFK
jgi:hypothetical protein